jgi:hypothetical protein
MNKITIKSSLTYIALLSVVGASVASAADTAGLGVSTTWGYQLPFIVFIAALVLLTVVNDYSRALRSSFEPRIAKAILVPANEVFGAATSTPVRRTRRVRHQLVRS